MALRIHGGIHRKGEGVAGDERDGRDTIALTRAAEGSPRAARYKAVHLSSAHPPLDSRIFHKQARTLAQAGYEVAVVAAHDRSEVVDGVQIRAVPPPNGRRDRMTATVRAVWRTALEEDADLYHFHDPELIPLGMRLKLAGKRVVYDVHEDLPRQILGKTWIAPWLRRSVAGAAGLAEHLGERAFDGIVAATPDIGRRFPPKKTVIVQNFPILDELTIEHAPPQRERPPTVAYVGRILGIRGARELGRAMALLPDDLQARLVLAGVFGEPGLEAECRSLPGWSRTDFLGWQTRTEIAALLGRTRAGLVVHHPARNYLLAYPVKLFEYMAAGLPVIASDFPLMREIVEGAGCGLLVEPHDPHAIAAAIAWVLEHPDEAQAMGERGRAAVTTTYNWDGEAKKLLSLYVRLLR